MFLVHNYKTCKMFALKHIKKSGHFNNRPQEATLAENEATIMKSLQHPCVVQMADIIETADSMFILLELMNGGDLLTRIQEHTFLPESLAKFYFYQICHAIKYLHDRKITHRDLKPDNILLASKANETLVKVSDFGLSKLVQNNSVMRTLCGTPLYVAPEVLLTNGRGEYTEKVDIWSLGVVLFTCLSGTLPFANDYGSPATEQIKQGKFRFASPNWNYVSDQAKRLVCELLTKDVDKRPSIYTLLEHPWLTSDHSMIFKAHELMKIPLPSRPKVMHVLRSQPQVEVPAVDKFIIPFEVTKMKSELVEIMRQVPIKPPAAKRARLA